jgi:uncharacterized membrane protein YkoI
MTLSTKTLGGAALAMLTFAAAIPIAQAQGNDDSAEARAFLASGMTLPDAVSAAEAARGGTALSAGWEAVSPGAWTFEVELAATDGTVTTVLVDPTDGAVTAMSARHDQDAEDDDDGGAQEDADRDGDDD